MRASAVDESLVESDELAGGACVPLERRFGAGRCRLVAAAGHHDQADDGGRCRRCQRLRAIGHRWPGCAAAVPTIIVDVAAVAVADATSRRGGGRRGGVGFRGRS
ncbi:MAG: hypothetical protein WKF58_05940 [Ilumatobacteraceae bacterium]